MKPFLLCISTVLLLQPALTLSYAEEDLDDIPDDVSQFRARRGWSMMRLGRGLQMLRLGKRAPSDSGSPASPEQMRAMLSAMVEESRNEYRRQPPLPRYGRELDLALTPVTSQEDLYYWLGQVPFNRGHVYNPLHYRRYRRSAGGARTEGYPPAYPVGAYPAYDYGYYYASSPAGTPSTQGSASSQQERAVALPRIGRYLGRPHPHRLSVKAVPVPRIGREDDVSASANDVTSENQVHASDLRPTTL